MPRHAFLWLALLTMPLLVGCEGCRPAGTENQNGGDETKAPLEAYSTESASIYPSDINSAFDWVKPGHWTTAEQSIRSNKADMRGELISQSEAVLRDRDQERVGTRTSLDTIRPVTLPKGQMRSFDFRFRVPVPNGLETRSISVSSRLIPRAGGVLETGGQPFNVMRRDEYFFVVLTSRPDQFTRIQVSDWARSTESQLNGFKPTGNYRIVIPDSDGLLPLPDTMLDLTSTAVILWDDLSEDALTPAQQLALSDWVRFGGRLIVNGPNASEAVVNTALADLLPLVPTSNIELSPAGAKELLEGWEVATDRSTPKQIQLVESEVSRIAIDGQLDPAASAVDKTGSLILSKRMGRGSVIQSRFDLTDDWIESWESYDNFFNSVVLNRPPRVYRKPQYSDLEEVGFEASELELVFAGTDLRADAAINTQLRIASRDRILKNKGETFSSNSNEERSDQTGEGAGKKSLSVDSQFDPFVRIDSLSGIGGWHDDSDLVTLFRLGLAKEAGIEIPGVSLVIRSLALYLIILVPVNYLVFRLLNRLEYAWFAVPFLAVFGAAWAARQARLDIGFARSTTELALLEIHPEYSRGHLTRLVGVYNSLSSRYSMQFPSEDGIAAPLENEPDPGTSVVPSLRVSFEEGPSLANFAVPSNRVRYVHSEEMVDLGGEFSITPDQEVSNESGLELLDALAVAKDQDGTVSVAFVGSLLPGESKILDFVPSDTLKIAGGLPMNVDQLMRRLAEPEKLAIGATQLIGRVDGSIAGMSITPPASQHSGQTLAVVHLRYPDLVSRGIDDNLPGDFRKVLRSGDEKKSESSDQDASSDANETSDASQTQSSNGDDQ